MTLAYEEWLTRQRWYAGRGRDLTAVRETLVVPLGDGLDLVLLDTDYSDGSTARYQVVVRWEENSEQGGAERFQAIGSDGSRTAFDGLYDPEAGRHLLALIDSSATVGPIRFLREPDAELPVGATPRVMGAEQSNTSVVFGTSAIFKAFRRVTPGVNPDIELSRVLARAGNAHVATLLGSIDTDLDGEHYALGMVTRFAAGSAEGWDTATASTQELFATDDGAGDGTSFADESRALGEAVASVHRTLAEELGVSEVAFPVDTLVQRLRVVAASVPELAPYVDRIEARYRRLADRAISVQRVHGDLHLGQVLRTPQTWLVIDFEGEPGQPLPERRRPDSALRDVAGMLRSYEYAAYQRLVEGGDSADELVHRARDWADGNRTAFCEGYATAAGADPRADPDVLAAYELDKAVYEAGYEARYRPAWLPIPMESIARLVG